MIRFVDGCCCFNVQVLDTHPLNLILSYQLKQNKKYETHAIEWYWKIEEKKIAKCRFHILEASIQAYFARQNALLCKNAYHARTAAPSMDLSMIWVFGRRCYEAIVPVQSLAVSQNVWPGGKRWSSEWRLSSVQVYTKKKNKKWKKKTKTMHSMFNMIKNVLPSEHYIRWEWGRYL